MNLKNKIFGGVFFQMKTLTHLPDPEKRGEIMELKELKSDCKRTLTGCVLLNVRSSQSLWHCLGGGRAGKIGSLGLGLLCVRL